MENLSVYINQPVLLGKAEEGELLRLKEKYPYFQALHILLAKNHKNLDAYSYHKSLKLASLYAGDRKLLYNFINRAEEPLAAPVEVKSIVRENEQEEVVEPENIEPEVHKQEVYKHEDIKPSPKQLDEIFGWDKNDVTQIKVEEGQEIFATVSNDKPVEKPLEILTKEETVIDQPVQAEENHSRFEPLADLIGEEIQEPTEEMEVINNSVLSEVVEGVTTEVGEEPTEIIEGELDEKGLEITLEEDSEIVSNLKTEEHDFYDWLDNFAIHEPEVLTEKANFKKEAEVLKEVENKEALKEPEHIDILAELEEINSSEEDVNLAGLAEIAYDIQAFVKSNDEPDNSETTKTEGKLEIDDLLDRFINKNPSISRIKTEFYKPENMARKSEEFNLDLASESLAALFYKQGHLHKSLALYEKLILQNPDKKDIFAARIQIIKEELINRL